MDPNTTKIGLKLIEDPFFQYIKSNRLIREIMIKPGEEFSPEKIVNLALRQDIGVDRSASIKLKNLKNPQDLDFQQKFK